MSQMVTKNKGEGEGMETKRKSALEQISSDNRLKFNAFVAECADILPAFPDNELNLMNGSVLLAKIDYPFLGLSSGDELALMWDGKFVRHQNLMWYVNHLVNEIRRGTWTVK